LEEPGSVSEKTEREQKKAQDKNRE
jgi:hypothetical protein